MRYSNIDTKAVRGMIVAFILSIFMSAPLDVFSQDNYITIGGGGNSGGNTGNNGRSGHGGKSNAGGGKNSGSTPVPAAKVTFDKNTNTLNYDGWQYQFVVVEGSKFVMGSVPGKPETSAVGTQAHKVNIDTYAIGNIEVPRWLWKAVTGKDPFVQGIVEENEMGAPVNNVSWNECQTFVKSLNKLTGMTFSLPTEAQWEYAARGGIHNDATKYSGTNDPNKLPAIANSLGIYSMSGLMKEWCSDWYDEWNGNAQNTSVCLVNPTGAESGLTKVVRGGSNQDYSLMEVTSREHYSPADKNGEIGFRLVLKLVK